MTETVRVKPIVLLIESHRTNRLSLAGRLDAAGYTVWPAESGLDARQMLAEARHAGAEPDVIVLDKVLPDVDGLVLAAFCRANTQSPIVLCSDPAESSTGRALGYHVGVDGFIASPPDLDELDALLQSLLRRAAPKLPAAALEPPADEELTVGSLVVREKRRSATLDSLPLGLTPTQYRVLAILARQPDGASTTDIARTVWNCPADDGVASLIATQVARLRVKLRDHSASAPSIVSLPGHGYRLLAA